MSVIEFTREMCRAGFDGCDLTGAEVLQAAERHGLVKAVSYDPEKHPNVTGSEYLDPGDRIYIFTEALAAVDAPIGAQGWIVGSGDEKRWRCWTALGPEWTEDREKATRYARREDAEAVHAGDEDAWIVVPYDDAAAYPWRCFHCDEVFTDERCARDHFGADETREPACRIKMGAERSMLTALRRAEADAADAWFKIHNEATDSAKAFYAQAARHQEQLRAAEELGYERGLRDAIPAAVIVLAETMAYLEGSDPLLISGGIRNADLREKIKTILFTSADATHERVEA
ncbi:hypothetical protein [Mesorhizobium sp.]|uniref:hypothetical protein n=1 Tax=Mesorhizobium sp. TaxID=1871066 RepID=UPI000FE8F165|nr:hypothetical protein [Mesorhizobium sp.]RWB67610.1 MAG: hypothetical protein EOQ49_25150 [Mesorhizobium sp.]